MWYAFWFVTLALLSVSIVWYAIYREDQEKNKNASTPETGLPDALLKRGSVSSKTS